MAWYHLIVCVALFLVSQPITAAYNSSSVDSFLNNLCEDVVCGKGTCKASLNYTFNFICECERGWRQIRDDQEDDSYRFQPCIYPNCSMNYACGEAPPPTPNIDASPSPRNISFYDPCSWAYCGDGSCSQTRGRGYRCDCRQGYSNLMNISAFPCFSDCVIGSDCAGAGVTLSNDSSVSTRNSDNHASSFTPRSYIWLIVFILSLALAPRPY